jgi:hypothetical protein
MFANKLSTDAVSAVGRFRYRKEGSSRNQKASMTSKYMSKKIDAVDKVNNKTTTENIACLGFVGVRSLSKLGYKDDWATINWLVHQAMNRISKDH